MNEHDSVQMARLLQSAGWQSVTKPEEADVVILNTCSVREKAVQKIRSEVGRLALFKQTKPDLLIGIAGCVAEQEKEKLRQQFPVIDFVVGPDREEGIAKIVEKCGQDRRDGHNGQSGLAWTGIAESEHEHFFCVEPLPGECLVKAPVVIQKGCDNYCSYCVVPYVRGSEVSRLPEDVLDEIKQLVDRGVKEVTLLGQNVNSYGQKMRFHTSFAQLLERIANETQLKRLRFATSHPKDVSDALVEQFAQNPILMPHFHLPAQCGSDRILALMNRGYTQADYLKIIDRVLAKAPRVKFSSDFIVGFPSESAFDFEQTLSLMRTVRFDQTFSFVYSPRPFTQAKEIPDDVSSTVKTERLKILQHLDQEIALERNKNEVGSIQEVLVERLDNVNPDRPNMGRTPANKQIYFSGQCRVGEIMSVKVTEGKAHYLLGEKL